MFSFARIVIKVHTLRICLQSIAIYFSIFFTNISAIPAGA